MNQQTYTNTAWMLEGAPCWVQLTKDYQKAHIQKLLQQRTIAKIILNDNTITEVPVADLIRASNSKVTDLTDLPHINQPEILFRITNSVYLDRSILTSGQISTLTDYIQYKKYIDDRLILSQIPPHIFSSIFFAYQNLDIQRNSQIFITGHHGSGKTKILQDLVQFMSKELFPIYSFIQLLVTDINEVTKAVLNFRFILKFKKVTGLSIQMFYMNIDDVENMQIFHKELPNDLPENLRELSKEISKENYQQFLEKVVSSINSMITFSEGIQIIGILDFPANLQYVGEKIEQIYIQTTFKAVQQQFQQDQLHELLNQIKYKDNSELVDSLENGEIKLNTLINKETQIIYIRLISTVDDIENYRIVDSIRFFKTSYPHKITFNEFYTRYHHLDAFNKKISLQKHLNSNQDMKALVTEISKRMNLIRGMIFGTQYIYMKKDVNESLHRLVCQNNLKLSLYAKKIQKNYRIRQFRNVVLASIKRLVTQKTLQEAPVVVEKKVKQVEQQEQNYVYEISDIESYQLLDEEQQGQYKKKKQEYMKKKQLCILQGTQFEDMDVAYSLLSEAQIQQRSENIQKKEENRKLNELQAIENEVSDQESFGLLSLEQKFDYVVQKKQNQQQVGITRKQTIGNLTNPSLSIAYRLLDHHQQQQIKQSRKLKKMKEFENKYYSQLEPFLSDVESFKQFTIQQLNEYKQRKFRKEKQVSLSLLNEQQKTQRRLNILQENKRYKQKKQFAMDDYLSDFESFKLLEPIQFDYYKLEKQSYKYIKQKQNFIRYGYAYEISDPESFLLLTDKAQWAQKKAVLQKCNDISDQEAYLVFNNPEKYIELKKEGKSCKELLDQNQYDSAIKTKLLAQQRLDELGIIKYELLDSVSFKMLTDEQWQIRKQQLEESLNKKKYRVSIGFLCDDVDSVAYDQLSTEQKQQRKLLEQNQLQLKQIINPILFEDEIHPNVSLAYKLLSDDIKDLVYYKLSLSQMLLKDPSTREQQLKEISLYYWEHAPNLSSKQQLLQEKITKYEQDKVQYQKEEFSDYEAFLLLDEEQRADYNGGAYKMLDGQQKISHRKILKSKLTQSGIFSDLESYQQLSDDSKNQYHKIKREEISDYPAFEQLVNKEEYYQQKQIKSNFLKEIKNSGFQVYFGQSPVVMKLDEYEEFIRKKQLQNQQIHDEEQEILKQIQSQDVHRKSSGVIRVQIISQLIAHPDSQPYLISKFQLNKRLLDIRSAPDWHSNFQLDNEMMELLEKNKFTEHCNAILQVKQIEKMMKSQMDKMKHPLTKVHNENAALNIFKSILKFSHMKRSRYPTKTHLERILCALIGEKAHIELPPPPNKLQRANLVDFDQIAKYNETLMMSRKFSDQEEFEANQELKEETLMQLFKQLENNKKDNIFHVLRLAIVITNCVQIAKPLPYISYLVDKLEKQDNNNKVFKDPEIFKYVKQLIKNLSNNTSEFVFKNEEKILITPRQYLPSDQEIGIMFECKQVVIKLFLHSETPIWIAIDHHYSVLNTVKAGCAYIAQTERASKFGLQLVQRKNDVVINSQWLQDQDNFMDILTKQEFWEDIYKNSYKLNRSFEIYLSIKDFYRIARDDVDSLELAYYQMLSEVKRMKFSFTPEVAQILQDLEQYVKSNGANQNNNFRFQTINEAKLEYLKIIRMADPNCLPEII